MKQRMNRWFLCALSLGALTLFMAARETLAQLGADSLSGVYGCTVREDRWGRTPSPGTRSDVSSLVWTLDTSKLTVSGIDLRFRFEGENGQLGKITREAPEVYRDDPVRIERTALDHVFKMVAFDGDEWYLVATNSGNTLLVSSASSSSFVSASGICQKV